MTQRCKLVPGWLSVPDVDLSWGPMCDLTNRFYLSLRLDINWRSCQDGFSSTSTTGHKANEDVLPDLARNIAALLHPQLVCYKYV